MKKLSVDKRLELIKRNTDEVLGESELKEMLDSGEKIKHYIGFEISNKPHIGHGLVCMSKVKDFMDAGVDCSVFLADWHSWINDKLGGDMEVIRNVGVPYFMECIKAGFECVGGNPEKLNFVLGSELYHNNDLYWATVMDVSKNVSLSRIMRSISIAGRSEGEGVDFAKLLYPPMQVADIFIQDVKLAHAGMDQRKAQVIAREVAPHLSFKALKNKKGEKIKPCAVHGHLILGLNKPAVWPVPKENVHDFRAQMKMSKSIASSAIFMDDDEETIRKKINGAFCLEGEIEYNPLLDWAKHVIFSISDKLNVERPAKFGGNVEYDSYDSLERDFSSKKLHPQDLKNAVASRLIEILKPARKRLSSQRAMRLKEEMDKVSVTR